MCRHSFPGAPIPGDPGWNSGGCVSWHSMARLQPRTEVVSCTALSALRSAHSGARSKPSLRLCRPPLVVARGEETAQPPAEFRSHKPGTTSPYGGREDGAEPPSCCRSRCNWPPQGQVCQPSTPVHPPRPPQLLFLPLPVPERSPAALESLYLPLTDAAVPGEAQTQGLGHNACPSPLRGPHSAPTWRGPEERGGVLKGTAGQVPDPSKLKVG